MKQADIEQAMHAELAPVDAKYWEGVDRANAFFAKPGVTLEEYRAMWNEIVVPYRKHRNTILRKYRRQFAKLGKRFRESPRL